MAEPTASTRASAERESEALGVPLLSLLITALIAVELVLAGGGHVLQADIADAVLLVLMLQLGSRQPRSDRSLISERARQAIGGLVLVALIRVVGIGLPLHDGSGPAGSLLVAGIIGISALVMAPSLGIDRVTLIGVRRPPLQLPVMPVSFTVGLVAYLLGAPTLWSTGASPAAIGIAVVAAAVAVTVEEVVFRGIVQRTLDNALGPIGIPLSCALFTATYFEAGSVSLVLTVALAGTIFAYSVVRTGSIGGAIGGHLLFALGAGAIWPALLGRQPSVGLAQPILVTGICLALVGLLFVTASAVGTDLQPDSRKRADRATVETLRIISETLARRAELGTKGVPSVPARAEPYKLIRREPGVYDTHDGHYRIVRTESKGPRGGRRWLWEIADWNRFSDPPQPVVGSHAPSATLREARRVLTRTYEENR